MSVKEYALRLKVELAKRLLLSSHSTLEELAERCGFCDASHLSRVFRQYAGCGPGEFRQRRDMQEGRTSVH
jgi:AraC-like DNA-binding protein